MTMWMVWKARLKLEPNVWMRSRWRWELCMALSGCGQWSAHRVESRNHACRHWRLCNPVSRKRTCCHWRPYRAVLPTCTEFHFSGFYFAPNFHCCHAVIVHPTFACSYFFTFFAPYFRCIWGVVFTKTEVLKEHFIAHNARRRCIKKNFKGIHDRFQKDLIYRDSQLRIGRTEEKCIEMDELAQKDFTYRPSTEELKRYQKNWSISLNTSGRNAPMKLQSDFSEALTNMYRLQSWVWRRVTCTDSVLPVSEMAFVVFFIQYIMVQWNNHWWSL